jgi:hypothetical protein
MFGFRSDIPLQTPECIGPIGQENHLLLGLHPLLAKNVNEPGAWPFVHRLHESESTARGIRHRTITME